MPAIISIGESLPDNVWQEIVENHIPSNHPIKFFINDLIETGIISRENSGIIKELPSEVSTMDELAVLIGIFPSKNQARKNNCIGEIPIGITEAGTKSKKIWIWKRI